MENKNLNILDEVNKGATMGMDAISIISEKVKDSRFKEVLDGEYSKYRNISERVNELYPNYSDKEGEGRGNQGDRGSRGCAEPNRRKGGIVSLLSYGGQRKGDGTGRAAARPIG